MHVSWQTNCCKGKLSDPSDKLHLSVSKSVRLPPVKKKCAINSCQTEVNPDWGAPYRYVWWQERSTNGRVHDDKKLIFGSCYQARAQKQPPNRAPVVAFIFVPYIPRIAWEGRKVVPLQKTRHSPGSLIKVQNCESRKVVSIAHS